MGGPVRPTQRPRRKAAPDAFQPFGAFAFAVRIAPEASTRRGHAEGVKSVTLKRKSHAILTRRPLGGQTAAKRT